MAGMGGEVRDERVGRGVGVTDGRIEEEKGTRGGKWQRIGVQI